MGSKVVEAVGFAVGRDATASSAARAKYIEARVTRAIREAQAKGTTDTDELRRIILEARDKAIESLSAPIGNMDQ